MNHSLIAEQIQLLASHHLPKNSTHFKYQIYDDKRYAPARGYVLDPKPFEGKVIAVDDTAIFVKTARTEFAVVDKALANHPVTVGSMVLVTPYFRRGFDGKRADEPKAEVRQHPDGTTYVTSTWVLGDVTVRIPLPKARGGQLSRLVQYLETLPAPDGFRYVSHLLVDAGAYEFDCVDPEDGDVTGAPPTISFFVSNLKFDGLVKIVCNRSSDGYAIELHREDSPIFRIDDLDPRGIARSLGELIDDGCWRQIRIEALSSRARRRSDRSIAGTATQ